MSWKWAAASEIGTSHIRTGDKLQDAYTISEVGHGRLIAVVSDGAGSAEFGGYGAWIVCRFIKVRFREWIVENDGLPEDSVLEGWIDDIREYISSIAKRRGSLTRKFASTLAALFILQNELLTIQIGDSAIVGRNGAEWEVICWPENGEYASTTYFVTDPEPRLKIIRNSLEYNAFALFSDGVGDLALLQTDRKAHSKFFEPMIKPIDFSTGVGRLSELSLKLGFFLAGPSVCERTDDDKTLLLISRI